MFLMGRQTRYGQKHRKVDFLNCPLLSWGLFYWDESNASTESLQLPVGWIQKYLLNVIGLPVTITGCKNDRIISLRN